MRKHTSANIICRFTTLLLFILCFIILSASAVSAAEPGLDETFDQNGTGFWQDCVSYPSFGDVKASMLYEIRSDQILYANNADQTVYPASIVKVMSGALLCEFFEYRMEETITVTSAMLAGAEGNSMKLKRDETVTVKDLLYGLIVGGYNDCANVLAVVSSGSVGAFVDRMNAKALSIGADRTHFSNASGLHHDEMVTTARDLLKICVFALQNDTYRIIAATERYLCPRTNLSDERLFYNRSDLVTQFRTNAFYDSRCIGLNAGYTDEGGYCAVTFTHSDSASFLCLALGGTESKTGNISSYSEIIKLLDWGEAKFGTRVLVKPGDKVLELPVSGFSTVTKMPLTVSEELIAFAPVSLDLDDLSESQFRLTASSLTPPIEKNAEVGYVRLVFQGRDLGTGKLVCTEEAGLQGLAGLLNRIRLFEKNIVVQVSFVSFVLLSLILTLVIRHNYVKKRKMSRYFYGSK